MKCISQFLSGGKKRKKNEKITSSITDTTLDENSLVFTECIILHAFHFKYKEFHDSIILNYLFVRLIMQTNKEIIQMSSI